MPDEASSGCGVPGVEMVVSAPPSPNDPVWHRPAREPMSPIPGTLQIPPAGWSSAFLLFTASRTAGAALADGAASAVLADSAAVTDFAALADTAVSADCAARAV